MSEKKKKDTFKENGPQNLDETESLKLEDEVEEEEAFDEEEFEKSIEDYVLEIQKLESDLQILKDADLRLKAEFDNFRKRTIKEKQEIYSSAKADCITPLLAVLDSLERALEASGDDSKLSQGVKLIVNQFSDALKKIGVLEIQSLGKEFDPNCHNAINVIEDEGYGHNTVCQVLQKGYMLNDTVIRHAMVVVANP